MHDPLGNGRPIRLLNVVDGFTRECLVLELSYSFGSADVLRVFDELCILREPAMMRFDSGPEFTSRAMLQWGADHRKDLHFIEPGKPT